MQHSNLAKYTIGQISIEILRYIFNYGSGFNFSQEIIKAGKRFFSNIPSQYSLLFSSLCQKLIVAIEQADNHLAFEAVRYIDFCYIKLMKHEHGVEELQYITLSLENIAYALKILTKKHK